VIRAVIDTNVLISGLLTPSGNAALILLAVRHGMLHPCFSEDILTEYRNVLGRPKFGFPPDEIAALLAMLRNNGEFVQPKRSNFVSPDPADTKFLHCAQAGQADFIVTGNKRHFPNAPYGQTQIVNAAELLDLITVEL
jgi:putative PIN family toxin of toxin-antitoxin system